MFVDGNPSIGRKATQFNAEWCNNVQMELWNAIKKVSGSDPAGSQTMDDFAAALDAWLGKVLADSDDTVPKTLYGKLLDSPTISFLNTTLGTAPGNRYVTAGVKDGSIDTQHIKDAAVKSAKIENGAVTENKLGNQSVSTDKIKAAAVKAVKLDTIIFEHAANDFVAGSGEDRVTTYTAVNARGFLDVTVDFLCTWGSTPEVGFSQVALEIRDHDSGTVLRTYSIGVPEYGTHYVKRFIVRNADTEAKNYDLYVSSTLTDNTPHGVTPTIGDFVSTGIVFN